ncbi:MAG: 2-dehydropantoate 2-reductase [Ramlibacter sp.]|nr:2-dehydropantoate 2-reductase [Ramlibacter sp.]
MKTVILGAGALGTIFAAHLAEAGHEVAVVAREPRASLLRRDGLRVRGLRELTVQVPVHTDASVADDAELVINALKTQQNPDVLPAIRPRKGAVAFSLQNGVYKDAELEAVFGREGVLGASAMISGEVDADGAARFTLNEMLLVGEMGGGISERSARIAKLLQDAGINTTASPDIRGVEWSKYALFVPMFCLALLTRQPSWRFLADPHGAESMATLAREMVRLAAAEGVALHREGSISAAALADGELARGVALAQAWGERMKANAPGHKVSALQDLEKGRSTEVDAIVGHAVRRARTLGLQLPMLESCWPLCSAVSALGAALTPTLSQKEKV